MARFDRISTRPDRQPKAGPWRHGRIPVLGLTGTIGAGKSLVASRLAERGALVLDADRIGHALLDQRPARDEVTARFGPSVLVSASDEQTARTIDRRALGAIVFTDPAAMRALEAILHPRMRRTFEKAIERTSRRGNATAVVLDAAILLEKGWNGLCDRVIYVDAPREQRLARLSDQRGWTAADLDAREQAQWPAEEKRRRADLCIDNEGDVSQLGAAVARLWSDLADWRPAADGRRPARTEPSVATSEPARAVLSPRRPARRRRPSRQGRP